MGSDPLTKPSNNLCDYEMKLLRELVTGEDQGLQWGAAMSVSIEFLSGSGYLTGPPNYKPTEKAKKLFA